MAGNHSVPIVSFLGLLTFSSDRKTGFWAVKFVPWLGCTVLTLRALFLRFPTPCLRAVAAFESLTVTDPGFAVPYRWVTAPYLSGAILYALTTEPAAWVKPSCDGAPQMWVPRENSLVRVQVGTFWFGLWTGTTAYRLTGFRQWFVKQQFARLEWLKVFSLRSVRVGDFADTGPVVV